MARKGFEILQAGSDTTARSMDVAVYYTVYRLKEELNTVMLHPNSVVGVEVLEPCHQRLSLIATEETLRYQDWVLPTGTEISMTPTRNFYDPAYFPNPTVFSPERWLQEGERAVAGMNHVFMPFAAGSQRCLGPHFAQAKLKIGLARMFCGFEIELWETETERDIERTWAHISGEPNQWGKGLRLKVTGLCQD